MTTGYHLLAVAISLALVIIGAGKWSIDREIASLSLRKNAYKSSMPAGSKDPVGS